MDKKRVIIFSSLILSLFLIGIFLAQGVNTIETTTNKVGLNTSGENQVDQKKVYNNTSQRQQKEGVKFKTKNLSRYW